jgi:hypothetical protein
MQKVIGTTAAASSSSTTGASGTSSNKLKLKQIGKEVDLVGGAGNNTSNASTPFDINSLMMAAFMAANKSNPSQISASSKLVSASAAKSTVNSHAKVHNDKENEMDESEQQFESNNSLVEEDESDSNYLNKLRRHKPLSSLNHADKDAAENTSIDNLMMGEPSAEIAPLKSASTHSVTSSNGGAATSGAKKRKRQFIAHNNIDELNDEADGDNNNTDHESDEHDEGEIVANNRSRRKTPAVSVYHSESGGEEEPGEIDHEAGEIGSFKNNQRFSDEDYENEMENGEMMNEDEMDEDYMGNNNENGNEQPEDEEEFGDEDEEDEGQVKPKKIKIDFGSKSRSLFAQNSELGGALNAQQQSALLAMAANLNQSQGQQQMNSSGGNNSKIFHVDAYCYLCKKEFCNKYFLRTHLANKHKVFLNGNELAAVSGASMHKLQNDLLKESKKKSQQQQMGHGGQSQQHRSSSASSSASTTHSSASSSASLSPVSHQQQSHSYNGNQSSNKFNGNHSGNMKNDDSFFQKNNDSQTNSASVAGGVEDFCELCNKQFCNKYYLKVNSNKKYSNSYQEIFFKRFLSLLI